MKLLKVLSLSLLLCTDVLASEREISRRPLYIPEDSATSIQNEDKLAMLEKEVQSLIGRVEVLEHTVSQLRSGHAASAPAAHHSPQVVTETITTSETHTTPALSHSVEGSATIAGGAVGLSEKKAYDEALLALKDNKLGDAEIKFADFIAKYPKSSILSNAYFWHGETFFRRNNFEKAAISYLKGYKLFPKAVKASDSLLKLSLSLGSMGKTKEACAMLVKLENEFKDRPANSIKRAKDARNKYGCSK